MYVSRVVVPAPRNELITPKKGNARAISITKQPAMVYVNLQMEGQNSTHLSLAHHQLENVLAIVVVLTDGPGIFAFKNLKQPVCLSVSKTKQSNMDQDVLDLKATDRSLQVCGALSLCSPWASRLVVTSTERRTWQCS